MISDLHGYRLVYLVYIVCAHTIVRVYTLPCMVCLACTHTMCDMGSGMYVCFEDIVAKPLLVCTLERMQDRYLFLELSLRQDIQAARLLHYDCMRFNKWCQASGRELFVRMKMSKD